MSEETVKEETTQENRYIKEYLITSKRESIENYQNEISKADEENNGEMVRNLIENHDNSVAAYNEAIELTINNKIDDAMTILENLKSYEIRDGFYSKRVIDQINNIYSEI